MRSQYQQGSEGESQMQGTLESTETPAPERLLFKEVRTKQKVAFSGASHVSARIFFSEGVRE